MEMNERTLLEALGEIAPESSKTTIRSWLFDGRVSVDGVVVKDPRAAVASSAEILLGKKKQYLEKSIEILYQDSEIIVVHKPAGLLTVPTETDLLENLHEYLKRNFKRRTIYPVHRLDREASGVIMFAFSEQSQIALKAQFEEHSILREYMAVVEGNLTPQKGMWQSYLLEDGAYYVRSVKDISRGKLATTHYEVVRQKNGISTVKVTLETGRKNQIRVHSSEAGFSILGDKKYRSNYEFHGRIALQACKLGITHPVSRKSLLFTKEPDPEFTPFLPEKA